MDWMSLIPLSIGIALGCVLTITFLRNWLSPKSVGRPANLHTLIKPGDVVTIVEYFATRPGRQSFLVVRNPNGVVGDRVVDCTYDPIEFRGGRFSEESDFEERAEGKPALYEYNRILTTDLATGKITTREIMTWKGQVKEVKVDTLKLRAA